MAVNRYVELLITRQPYLCTAVLHSLFVHLDELTVVDGGLASLGRHVDDDAHVALVPKVEEDG